VGGGGIDPEEFENRQSEIFRYTLRLGECRRGGGSTGGGQRRESDDDDGSWDRARSAGDATDRSVKQKAPTTKESNASNHTGKNDLQQRRSGSGTETLACDVGHFSEQGVGPCVECPRGKFQDTCRQTLCKLCPAERAMTLETKSVHINACYFAEIGVERVWRSSRVLNLQVYWKLVPAAFARIGDKIALFKGSVLQNKRRQLAWSYTSTQSYITDNADLQPGDTALNEGSRTFRFNSAGEGEYRLYFYLSMSPPLVHAFSQNFGNIIAEHAFNLSEHAFDNSTFRNALIYDLEPDVGDRICNGGLVCPDGTGALYTSHILRVCM